MTAGLSATFSVSATGSTPLSYQWRFNMTNIAGATTNTLTITNAQATNAGLYSVVITNIAGTNVSSNAVLTVTPPGVGNVLIQWDFNSPLSDTNSVTGTRAASFGVGTNSYVGGTRTNVSGEFASGSLTDPNTDDNSAWITSNYPASTASNKTAGVQFNVSTLGRQNLVIRWDQRASNTGSKYARLQYTTNGADFIDHPSSITVGTLFGAYTNSLIAIPGVNNNSNFAFRIVTEFQFTATGGGVNAYVAAADGSTYGTGGTLRFDMVTVFADPIPTGSPPPSPALLGAAAYLGGQFQMMVTGTPGTNYIVETSPSLTPGIWTALKTNAAPFLFTDPNAGAFSNRYYRAVWKP